MNDGSLEIECRIDPKLVDNPDNMGDGKQVSEP
jgi:hypothetical protein